MQRFAAASYALFFAGALTGSLAAQPPEGIAPKIGKASVSISGTVRNDSGTPLCALILANGQFMFSCSPAGSYKLELPLDSTGQYTLFGFADGHFPYKGVFSSGGTRDITLTVANKTWGEPLIPKLLGKLQVRIFGTITDDNGSPLSALVLANGQFTFSGADGKYALDLPLDSAGTYTLFVFADGHFPYRGVFIAAGARDVNVRVAPPPAAGGKVCRGMYEATIKLPLCNNALSARGEFVTTGVDYDRLGPFAGTLDVTGVPDIWYSSPGDCYVNSVSAERTPYRGAMDLSRIGHADFSLSTLALHAQFSLGTSSVLGTLDGEYVTGRFSCAY